MSILNIDIIHKMAYNVNTGAGNAPGQKERKGAKIMTKVRIVYKPGTIESKVFENGMEIREYAKVEDAMECLRNYAELACVAHVHYAD